MNDTEVNPETSALLDRYHEVLGRHAAASIVIKDIKSEKYEIEQQLTRIAQQQELETFGNALITIRATEKMRIAYDAETWADTLKELVASGHGDLLMRKVVDSRALALLAAGVELPKGLRVETFIKIGYTKH